MQKAFDDRKPIRDPAQIGTLGTILSVWAHPDDETYMCGAIMAAARANGQRVVCVTATRGEAGSQNLQKWPSEELAKVRTNELETALRILGVNEHHWLDYPDGECCSQDSDNAARRIADIMEAVQPDTIFTFGRDGMTGHPDHQMMCEWVCAAMRLRSDKTAVYHPVIDQRQYEGFYKRADEKLNIFFAIDRPPLKQDHECDIHLLLNGPELRAKREAIRAMPSQTEMLHELFTDEELDAALGTEAFILSDEHL